MELQWRPTLSLHQVTRVRRDDEGRRRVGKNGVKA